MTRAYTFLPGMGSTLNCSYIIMSCYIYSMKFVLLLIFHGYAYKSYFEQNQQKNNFPVE